MESSSVFFKIRKEQHGCILEEFKNLAASVSNIYKFTDNIKADMVSESV